MQLHRFLLASSFLAFAALIANDAQAQAATAATASEAPGPGAAADGAEVPDALTDEELEVLVARIALYPDELVALVSAASLYPLQIVEADRFLAELKTDKTLKPKSDWDGSVISLLNYPEIVKMMSQDLDWTQALGTAILNQQDDVLAAIQQLRAKALANNVITSDDKMTVTETADAIVIEPASKEVIYVPQYEPEMLYAEDYTYAPVTYYPEPYDYYYDPGAAFFAGAITGAFWAAVVDWDDGFWGGDWDWGDGWNGGDVDFDFDCNNCIIGSDFNGKLNIRDADWKKIDRSKINFDKSKLDKVDRSGIRNKITSTERNRVKNKPGGLAGGRASTLPAKGSKPVKDVRASTLEGLKQKPAVSDRKAKPGEGAAGKRPQAGGKVAERPAPKKSGNAARPAGKKKPGAKVDTRPRNPSPMGDMSRGIDAKKQSSRGHQSMGGGYKRPSVGGGGGHSVNKRPVPRGGGGGGRGGGRGRR